MTDETSTDLDEVVETIEAEEPTEAETEDEGLVEEEADEPEADGEEEDEDDSEPEEEELVEFDFGGNKFAVKKGEIPDELAEKIGEFTKKTWADYTRKSQTVTEQVKAIEAQRSAVDKLANLQGQALEDFAHGKQLSREIEQLKSVDLNQMWQSDPDRARQISDALNKKQAELQQVIAKVNKSESEFAAAQKEHTEAQIKQGREIVTRAIKDFEQKAPEVVDYVVKNYGVPKEEAENWPANPVAAQMAYKAMMFDKMQTKAKTAAKKPASAKAMKPTKGKGGKSTTDIENMSMAEYAKHMNAKDGIGR